MLVGLLLAVLMVGAVMVPVISSSTTRTTTTTIENEGAGWLALGYEEGTDYVFTVGFETVSVDDVETEVFTIGTQTGEFENMICYADADRTLFVSGDYWYLLTVGEPSAVYQFVDTAKVTNASGTLTIEDGSTLVYSGTSPAWAYVPDANGVYGFFTEGGLNLEEGKPKVAVGSYAGVFAYNDTVVAPNGYGDLGLTMSGDYAEGEVIWMLAPSELDALSSIPTDTLEPAVIDLEPISLDPIDLGGSGSVGLMAVPTPTYTDGVWGFDTVFGHDDQARIVSYSGVGGDIVVPSTVTYGGNTYTVTQFGKGNSGNYVFDNNSIVDSTLKFPDTLTMIRSYACSSCSHLTGDLVIPDSVTSIDRNAFASCNFTSLTIPAHLTALPQQFISGNYNLSGPLILSDFLVTLGDSAFASTNFDGCLVIPETVTSVGATCFNANEFSSVINLSNATFGTRALDCQSVKEVLNLGESEFTTTSYGLNADSVQDHVNALGYIAPISIHESEVVPIDSPVAGILQMLPLVAGVGVLIFGLGMIAYNRW